MVLQSSRIDVKLCNGVCLPQHYEKNVEPKQVIKPIGQGFY
jgi:hypothetical protein